MLETFTSSAARENPKAKRVIKRGIAITTAGLTLAGLAACTSVDTKARSLAAPSRENTSQSVPATQPSAVLPATSPIPISQSELDASKYFGKVVSVTVPPGDIEVNTTQGAASPVYGKTTIVVGYPGGVCDNPYVKQECNTMILPFGLLSELSRAEKYRQVRVVGRLDVATNGSTTELYVKSLKGVK